MGLSSYGSVALPLVAEDGGLSRSGEIKVDGLVNVVFSGLPGLVTYGVADEGERLHR
ncbi:hypothetical protein GCM10023088_07950 [Actinomadura verrucosospora]|uniref:hypothetical protein n=1 Tax=Actinomadura TaxID=1988 RepID=UPI00190F1102|nr:hypothetical protein [Actinomadura sp. K4S16]